MRLIHVPLFLALAAGLLRLDTARSAEAQRSGDGWERAYQQRLAWWSLQPIVKAVPPAVKDASWPRNEVDRFILSALEARGLKPAAEAGRRVLARRLSFALTGLPPAPDLVERYVADHSARAFEELTEALLSSPHFGERWARHWMDVVHYSDTHGYEWDAPAKNAWMYRDYLVRAFNGDVPFRRLVLEQIAGDVIEPRIDPASGLNEALIGPMALRLGERRHGDNAAAEGITQEAMANVIDTLGKGFLATTIACAQCHDHKLDAVAQRDYYALSGIFMSTRWDVRCADAADPNLPTIEALRRIKQDIRRESARLWLSAASGLAARIRALPATNKTPSAFPETLTAFWQRSLTNPITAVEFHRERQRRLAENAANLKVLVDFTTNGPAAGWRWDGSGMRHGLVGDGEPVVAARGDAVLEHLLPAGRWSHVWSMRLAGRLQSPLFDPQVPAVFSIEYAAGKHAAESFIIDQALHSERMKFLNQPALGWMTLKAGDFDTLEGSLDTARRRVYHEMATKALNNYFPPRTGYGGVKEADEADESSWFGVTRIVQHPPRKPPLDELTRFVPLFSSDAAWADRLAALVTEAVERWSRDQADGESVRLLNDALSAGLLPNSQSASPALAKLVQQYRTEEGRIQPDRTVGSMTEWNEARNERIGIRGSYTDLGDEVPRGGIRFLDRLQEGIPPQASGRLELAKAIANDRNPLAARVFVNRVWQHLFGEGLVRTPDDFGHLGEAPSHPQLLDYLAARFIEEGWSLKRLVSLLVSSATWRQDSRPSEMALNADAENRLWHHMPMRRLDAEAIRDSVLAVSGRLDPRLFGPPVNPYRTAQDAAKRLFSGPLDGGGRRSLYVKMTMMEPPRFLALFNQPIPKVTTGRRDKTSVPDQALAMLNDPFIVAMARYWGGRAVHDGAASPEERARAMFAAAFGRPPAADEVDRLVALARRAASLRGGNAETLLACTPAWNDVAHALFNLKEFLYVP